MRVDRRVMDHGEIVRSEDVIQTVDGPRTFISTKSPYCDSSGQTIGVIGVFRDITESRKLDRIERARESLFLEMAEHMHEVCWIVNAADASILYVSPSFASVWGRSCEAIYEDANEWMDAIHPDDHKSVTACYEQALKGEKYDQEYRIIRGEGEIVWIHDRGNLTYDAKGWPLHLVGIAEDVTHRRTSEDDLRTERERLRLAYEAGTVGTWDWDVVRDEEHCSREYFMLYGLPPEPGLSSFDSWSQRVHPDDQDEAMKQALKAIDSGDTYECEYRVTWPDGSVHWLASRGKVYRDERGTAVRMIGVNVDVSDQKMVEATLRDHEEQLKKS
jgi:PAS domain S-box-containing protein